MKLIESHPALVYKALIRALKNDGILSREIKTWMVGEGDRQSIEAEPSDRTRPMLKLTPIKSHTIIADTCSLRSDFNVTVELWIESFSYFDMLNLWDQIEAVVFAEKNEEKFESLGIIKTIPQMTRMEFIREDYSTYAEGIISMDMFQNRH